jgi:uncharacterized protein (DUF1501 family)
MALNRKQFLSQAGVWLFNQVWVRSVFADESKLSTPAVNPLNNLGQPVYSQEPLLVNIFLRGGADGLNIVFPTSGTDRQIYESERPNIKHGSTGKDVALALNDHFALHPSAVGLHDLYETKKLAVFHATGLQFDTRSHFDAQNLTERGTVTDHALDSGWMARLLLAKNYPGRMPSVSMGQLSPTSMLAYTQNSVVDQLNGINWPTPKKFQPDLISAVQTLYTENSSRQLWLSELGTRTLETMQLLNDLANQNKGNDAHATDYPKADIGNRLQALAKLVKENVGIKIATVDMGGWDTHKNQGVSTDGPFSNLITQLSQAVKAFYDDVSSTQPLILTIQTEFGRRLKENSNRGTDHGHGGVMFVVGDRIKGGQMYGKWPGLKTEQLYQRADVAVTTDYRQVFSEILAKHTHAKDLAKIFPQFVMKPSLKFLS